MIYINSKKVINVICIKDVKSKNIIHCKKGNVYKCIIVDNYKHLNSDELFNALKIISNENNHSHIIAIRKDLDWNSDKWFAENFKIYE